MTTWPCSEIFTVTPEMKELAEKWEVEAEERKQQRQLMEDAGDKVLDSGMQLVSPIPTRATHK